MSDVTEVQYESTSTKTKKTALWEALSEEDKLLPVFSFSQGQTFGRCEFLWHINYRLGYDVEKSPALFKGTILHRFAQDFYEHLKADPKLDPNDWISSRLTVMVEELMAVSDHGETFTNLADCTWLFSKYLTAQPVFDEQYKILEVEKHFLQKFTTPRGREFFLQGYIDLLLEDQHSGRLWLEDHKSSTKFWSPLECQIDPQMPTYMALLRAAGLDIFGIIFNMLNTYPYKRKEQVKMDQLFKQEKTHRTPREVDNVLLEFCKRVDRIMDAPDGELDRSLSKDCAKSCRMYDPCLFGLKGMSIVDVLEGGSFIRRGEEKKVRPRNDVGISLEV